MIRPAMAILAVSLALSASDIRLMSVSDYPYTLGGEPAVSITIGKSDREYCDITVQRDQIKPYNMIEEDNTHPNKAVDARCFKNGKTFSFLTRGTYSTIFLNIFEFDKKKNKAKISISLKLFNPETKQHYVVDGFVAEFSGKNFRNLTTIPKDTK